MTTSETALDRAEIERYYDEVRAALADLPADARDELLEDLPDHLAEVAAEAASDGNGSLRERLGEPAGYAEELRAAAGFEPSKDRTAPAIPVLARAGEWLTVRWRGADRRIGAAVGYPRLADLARAARPGWWLLRGWLVAQLVAGAHDRTSGLALIPRIGGSRFFGLIVTIALIGLSVWFGRRSEGFGRWPRRAIATAGTVLALWAVFGLAASFGGTVHAAGVPVGFDPAAGVTDVYVYDQSGHLVSGARLYDQQGNPVQLGTPACADGSAAPGAVDGAGGFVQVWTYPLCPSDPGPFRAGPGAASGASGTTPSASPSVTAPAPSPAVSGTAPRKPSGSVRPVPSAKSPPSR